MLKTDDSWKIIRRRLQRVRMINLPKGKPFRATFNESQSEIIVVPSLTGIERHIGREEFDSFVEKFNQVKTSGYDPMKPGHYQQITYNSSYLVAIVREFELNKIID